MKTQNIRLIFIGLFLLLVFTAVSAKAELGEVAGQPNFNVSLGQSETLNVTLLNSGDEPIGFSVVMPVLSTVPDATTPTVTAYPMNGIIQPRSPYRVAITVHMPTAKNKPGLSWTGVMQFLQVSNVSNPGGAVLQVGVAKIVTITAMAAAKPEPSEMYLLFAALAVVCAGAVAYYVVKLRAKKHRAKW